MSRYLDIASQVLRELGYEKNEINEKRVHGLTLAEIRRAAGEDWPSLEADSAMLSAFAHALQARRMRERGDVPSHYTAVTHCRGCGPVPIFSGVPKMVEGCPWCFVRVTGGIVPRPTRQRRVVGRTVANVEVVADGDKD